MDRFHLQRYLGDSVRVSKTAVWLKKDRGTHEWQIELVQILEKLRLFKRETPAITVPIPAESQTETTNEPATAN